MQKIITEFKNEIPDYIDKIFTEKLSPGTQSYNQEGSVSFFAPEDSEFDPDVHYVPLKLEKTGAGVADPLYNTNREIVSQNNREPSSLSKYHPPSPN